MMMAASTWDSLWSYSQNCWDNLGERGCSKFQVRGAISALHCMSYSLNSLEEVILGITVGTTMEDIQGETRSLDYESLGIPKLL